MTNPTPEAVAALEEKLLKATAIPYSRFSLTTGQTTRSITAEKLVYRNPDGPEAAVTLTALMARVEELEGLNYKTFTDGLEAGAEICGSLAETTYDDADAFEAATGCEAAIMKVVRQQRKEQSEARNALKGNSDD